MNARKIIKLTRRELRASPLVPAIIVFIAILSLIGFSWRTARNDVKETRNSLISERATLSENNVIQQVYSYENALLAGQAFVFSSDAVDRDEWRSFVDGLQIDQRRQGMLALGYTDFFPKSALPAYEARVRSEGFPLFKVWPVSESQDYISSITYIEPYKDINYPALGYNMYSDSSRREAMNRAIETGEPAMTSKILLVQGGENRIPGLNLYQALYRKGAKTETAEQRRAATIGFVYSPFISEQLFGSVFKEKDTDYNVKVFDGTETNEDKLLYQLHKDDSGYNLARTDVIEVAGVQWTFVFSIRDSVVPAPIRERPRNSLIGGIILALVVSSLVYVLLLWRTKSLLDKEERQVQRAKDNMLSLASHQLRTPATGVKQYIGMVLEGFAGDLPREQRKFLQSAYDSNERQLRIINEFLYLAKAEADRIVVSPQRFDLGQLVTTIVGDMQSEVDEAGHTMHLTVSKRKIFCAADIHCMRMIVENLISNAIKYTSPGGNIHVSVKSAPKESLVVVQDNGVGIAEKDFPKLFKQFSRISNERTKQVSGSGIGLYLAQQLAERNKGYITLTSKEGKGSEFTLHMTTSTVKNFTETNENKG